jgi:hypothetical protein
MRTSLLDWLGMSSGLLRNEQQQQSAKADGAIARE